jgi:spermidine synthase
MAMGWATDDAALSAVPVETLRARFAQANIEMQYYTPEVHAAAFALPRYVQKCFPS